MQRTLLPIHPRSEASAFSSARRLAAARKVGTAFRAAFRGSGKVGGLLLAALVSLSAGPGLATARAEAAPIPLTNPALTNWQTALQTFTRAGRLLGCDCLPEARRALAAAALQLPAPYATMARSFLHRLDALPVAKDDERRAARLLALSELCADLRAWEASLRLRARAGESLAPEACVDEPTLAWRLAEAGDTNAAVQAYRLKAEAEPVDTWREYFQAQIELLRERATRMTDVTFVLRLVQEHYLKGFEQPADHFGALSALWFALPHTRNLDEAVQVHQAFIQSLDALGDEAGRDAWEDRLLANYAADPEACAAVHLERGLRAYDRRDLEGAATLFRKIATEFAQTRAYGDAQLTLGLILQQQGKFEEAIAEYEKIFPSHVNDRALVPGKSDDYPNYRYRAALRISECYAERKNYPKAIEYAELARDRYPFDSYCKTCIPKARAALEAWLTRLHNEARAAGPSREAPANPTPTP